MTVTFSRGLGAALLFLAGCGGGGGGAGDGDDFLAGLACAPTVAPVPAVAPGPPISLASPFAADCAGLQSGTLYRGAEVEPFAAVDPLDPDRLIAVWQQDRWSNGGAQGLLAVVSGDGGQSWEARQVPFSVCSGGNAGNGGNFLRATDPWVDFGPDGKAYWMSLSFTLEPEANAMLVSRSLDGGDTWGDPVTLVANGSGFFNDKNTLTADPNVADHAYAVWERLDFAANRGPTLFSRTTDGGLSWEPARSIYDIGDGQTIGNIIAVHPGGTLVNLFVEINYASDRAFLRVIRSTDRGLSWSGAVTIAELLSVGVFDPDTGTPIRGGTVVPAIAVSPTGRLAVAWGDARFSGGARDGIALSWSDDAGLTWTAPRAINGEPCAQAFTPALRFLADGTLGVGYYDLRDNTPEPGTLPVAYWLGSSTDLATWSEQRVAGPVDMTHAPDALGLFLGDYAVVLPAGTGFRPVFALPTGSRTNRTDMYSAVVAPGAATAARAYRSASTASVTVPALSPEARLRVRRALLRALPLGRHDGPPVLEVLPVLP